MVESRIPFSHQSGNNATGIRTGKLACNDGYRADPPDGRPVKEESVLRNPANKGSALLMVLWLTVGLAAIAFGLANSVRAETERASTSADGPWQ